MTNVFISWSGDTSREIAEELRRWVPSVLQFAKPYFTPEDIEKGSKWATEISKKLADSHIGLICLTKENYEKPWILFEAGALAKDLDKSKVCSILFDLDTTDFTGPLTNFQTTQFEKNDFKKMMWSINQSGDQWSLDRDTFESVFQMWWPKLQASVEKILSKPRSETLSAPRSDRDLLEEVLEIGRLNLERSENDRHKFYSYGVELSEQWLRNLEGALERYEESDKILSKDIEHQIRILQDFASNTPQLRKSFTTRVEDLRQNFNNIIPF
jgi:hypothetical protein